jgi:hypothetical protein
MMSSASISRAYRRVVYGFGQHVHQMLGGTVARDPDTIQREIDQARDALVETVNVLTERANPKRLVDDGKQTAKAKLADPRVKYVLIGVGAVVGLLLLRKLIR